MLAVLVIQGVEGKISAVLPTDPFPTAIPPFTCGTDNRSEELVGADLAEGLPAWKALVRTEQSTFNI